jgi:serine/threonine protein kinase
MIKFVSLLVFLVSLIVFQPLHATYQISDDFSPKLTKSSVITDEYCEEKPLGFFERAKNFILSVLPNLSQNSLSKSSDSHHWWAAAEPQDQPWAREWSKLVGHVVEENSKQTIILSTNMTYRRNEYASSHGQNIVHHKKLTKQFGEEARIIKKFDKPLIEKLETTGLGTQLTILVNQANSYLEFQNTPQSRQRLVEYRSIMADFYQRIKKHDLDQEYYDGDLFKQGYSFAKCLWKIGNLERRSSNLPLLRKYIKDLYTSLDDGKLSHFSQEMLNSLGINDNKKQGSTLRVSSKKTGISLLFLLTSSALITMTSAQLRPSLLGACFDGPSTSYGSCESSFGILQGFDTEIALLKSNIFVQRIINEKILQTNRGDSLFDTIIDFNSMKDQYYGEIQSFRTGPIPDGNTTHVAYLRTIPFPGMLHIPVSSTQINQTIFHLNGIGDLTIQVQGTNLTPLPMNPFYFGQLSESEKMIIAITNANQTWPFVYGLVVDRPFGQAPSILREGIITLSSYTNFMKTSGWENKALITDNINSALNYQDINTVVGGLYSGLVAAQPDCSNPRSITAFLQDYGYLSSQLFQSWQTCLAKQGLSPLACVDSIFLNTGPTRVSYTYIEEFNGQPTLNWRALYNTSYTETRYQPMGGNVKEVRTDYTWHPKLSIPSQQTSTVTTLFSTLTGSLQPGQVEKLVYLNLFNSTAGFIIRASQNVTGTSFTYYALPGPELCIFNNPVSSGPITSTTPITATSPSTTNEPNNSPQDSNGLSDEAKIGIGVGVGGAAALGGGAGFLAWKLKENEKNRANNVEFGERTTGGQASRKPSTNAFTAVQGQGIKDKLLTIEGTYKQTEWGIYFKVTPTVASEIYKATGLLKANEPFSDEEQAKGKKDLVLGSGHFSQVRVAQRLTAKGEGTGEFAAIKIVRGNEKVTSSLHEGQILSRLKDDYGNPLPGFPELKEYLLYKPGENKAAMETLLRKTYGDIYYEGRDMTQENLLLQVTTLGTFGNGGNLCDALYDLKDLELKDQLLIYLGQSLLTNLVTLHDFGVSHLDLKPDNVLFDIDGDLVVADMGLAFNRDVMKGGDGDRMWFAPERMAYERQVALDHGHKQFETQERVKLFSGHKTDDFSAGLTLLYWALHGYPFGEAKPVLELIEERNSNYYMHYLNQAFQEVRINYAKVNYGEGLSILPIIKDLLQLDPKSRLSSRDAKAQVMKLELKASKEELFAQLLAGQTTPQAVNITSDTKVMSKPVTLNNSNVYFTPSKEKKKPETAYGHELSYYNELQKVYSEDMPLLAANNNKSSSYTSLLISQK